MTKNRKIIFCRRISFLGLSLVPILDILMFCLLPGLCTVIYIGVKSIHLPLQQKVRVVHNEPFCLQTLKMFQLKTMNFQLKNQPKKREQSKRRRVMMTLWKDKPHNTNNKPTLHCRWNHRQLLPLPGNNDYKMNDHSFRPLRNL